MKTTVQSKGDSSPPRCAYCHEASAGLETCSGCGVLTHRDCREMHGRCLTIGCVFVENDPAHRVGFRRLATRLLGGAASIAFILVVVVLGIAAEAKSVNGLVAGCAASAAILAFVLGRAVVVCRRARRLLETKPEPLFMSVRDEGDAEGSVHVATFSLPGEPGTRTRVPFGWLGVENGTPTERGEVVLVYGAEGRGPFVVARPGVASLALLAPIFGRRLPRRS